MAASFQRQQFEHSVGTRHRQTNRLIVRGLDISTARARGYGDVTHVVEQSSNCNPGAMRTPPGLFTSTNEVMDSLRPSMLLSNAGIHFAVHLSLRGVAP